MDAYDYKRYLNILRGRQGLFVAVALLLMTAVFVASFLIPQKYEAACTVVVEKKLISELVQGLAVVPSVEDTINVLTIAITSRPLLKKVVQSLDLPPEYQGVVSDELINRMQSNTTVKVKEKNVFTISYVDGDPRVARDYLNTLVRLYVQESISAKRGESADATDFLSGQLAEATASLKKADAAITAFKLKSGGLVAMDEAQLLADINAAQQRLYEVQAKRLQLEGMRLVTRKESDPRQVKLFSLLNRLDELRVQYTDSYPDVVSVKEEIKTLKEQMQTHNDEPRPLPPEELGKINAELDSVRSIEVGLKRFISSNRKVMQEVPAAKATLERLESDQQNQRSLYDQLSARRGKSELSEQVGGQDQSSSLRVINPAVLPTRPATPNRLAIMVWGIVGSVAASFGLLVLLDQMDSSMKDIDSVKKLGAPLLAVIPRMEDGTAGIKRRRTRLLYLWASSYFFILLCFPAVEFLQLPYPARLFKAASGVSTPPALPPARDLLLVPPGSASRPPHSRSDQGK